MIVHRPASTRGNPRADWIDSRRTFTFPGYFDPQYVGFGDLKVINDDRVLPGGHVPIHEHRDMEIFGYVVEGDCRHTDSHGAVLDIPAGGVQRMTCGTGIWHTEGNAGSLPNRYLQLWIHPSVTGTPPQHEWKYFSREEKLNTLCDVTAVLPIKQDARLLCGIFNRTFSFDLDRGRMYYAYIISGVLDVCGIHADEGDGFSFIDERMLDIVPVKESEVILFDLRRES